MASRLPEVQAQLGFSDAAEAWSSEDTPSNLARFLGSLRNASPEARVDASLVDVVDSASRSLHQASQRHKPSAQLVLSGMSSADRTETLVWLVQAFSVMSFSDGLLFDTAMLLDRYYACAPHEDHGSGSSQRKLLAAVCMAMKTGSPVDTHSHLRQVITHLGRDQVPFDEVLGAELHMLRKLRFTVGTPTARDFLEAICSRLGHGRPLEPWRCLAEYLLQLTLVEAPMHYRYPHAVLAGAAVALALHATRAPCGAYTVLLEDLATHSPEAAAPHGPLVQCCAALHVLWVRSTAARAMEQNTYAESVAWKFARPCHFGVSSMTPTATSPTSLPPPSPTPSFQPGVVQDDLDEAIHILQGLSLDNGVDGATRLEDCRRPGRSTHGDGCAETAEDLVGRAASAVAAVGKASEDPQAAAALSARLRGVAEVSWRVRLVLARHGWSGGRFRILPNCEQLLRDLVRSARNRVNPKVVQASQPKEPKEPKEPRDMRAVAAVAASAADSRRRRSSSWCGHRCAVLVPTSVPQSP